MLVLILQVAGGIAAWFILAAIVAVPVGKVLEALGKADRDA